MAEITEEMKKKMNMGFIFIPSCFIFERDESEGVCEFA